ncbi:ParB/RepB/Spo0J family partition protein [Deinococcus budaensis]|uniref:ParB family chromosome partitioning protein n=1 Tax=Deinococcus budaensis TaxID=1665626 RepID=A0A7W8GEX8_9DEIO|nr:ParB/RepB/Spo0J family partition protein [Deinococcus budaensis]MBB5234253.1 ParB family chromosome partitioning protein [Deinococcus budaensis]
MTRGRPSMEARTPAPATVLNNLDLARARIIPLTQIRLIEHHNPRGRYSRDEVFSEESLSPLVRSVRERGVLQPVLLRATPGGHYELVAGERRFRAAQLAGLSGVPAVVETVADADLLEYALIENLQREAMNPVDQTFGVLELLSQRTGHPLSALPAYLNRLRNGTERDEHRVEETLQQVGGWTLLTFATRNVKFLGLRTGELDAVAAGKLTSSAAFELLPLGEHERRPVLLEEALRQGWSAKELRAQVQRVLQEGSAPSETRALVSRVRASLTERRVGQLSAAKRKELQRLVEQLESLLQEERPRGPGGRRTQARAARGERPT